MSVAVSRSSSFEPSPSPLVSSKAPSVPSPGHLPPASSRSPFARRACGHHRDSFDYCIVSRRRRRLSHSLTLSHSFSSSLPSLSPHSLTLPPSLRPHLNTHYHYHYYHYHSFLPIARPPPFPCSIQPHDGLRYETDETHDPASPSPKSSLHTSRPLPLLLSLSLFAFLTGRSTDLGSSTDNRQSDIRFSFWHSFTPATATATVTPTATVAAHDKRKTTTTSNPAFSLRLPLTSFPLSVSLSPSLNRRAQLPLLLPVFPLVLDWLLPFLCLWSLGASPPNRPHPTTHHHHHYRRVPHHTLGRWFVGSFVRLVEVHVSASPTSPPVTPVADRDDSAGAPYSAAIGITFHFAAAADSGTGNSGSLASWYCGHAIKLLVLAVHSPCT